MRIFKNRTSLFLVLFSLAVFCHGQENVLTLNVRDVSTDASRLHLSITKGKKIIQKIEYEYPSECFENAVFVEKRFEMLDVNFDGFRDILIYLGSHGNQGVVYKDCFLWNEENQSFENYSPFKNIPNPQIDENEKCVYGHSRNNSSHYVYEFYSWNKNELACNYKIHEVHSALQLAELYEIKIPENKDAGEYVLEHFGLDKTLYESVFYVKFSYDEHNGKKVTVSAPSVTLFDEMLEQLKCLINADRIIELGEKL